MLLLISILVVGLFSLAGRAHGAGENAGWPSWARTASTVIFAFGFGGANYLLFGIWWLALAGGALSAFGLATGHGRFYGMQGANLKDPNPEWIERRLVMWWYPGDISKPLYSYVCMAVKGAIIGAAVFPFGLLLILLWPICYDIGFHFWRDSAQAERMSGACAGLVLSLALISCLPSDLGLVLASPLFSGSLLHGRDALCNEKAAAFALLEKFSSPAFLQNALQSGV